MSFVCIIALLCRWAASAPEVGGFRSEEDRASATRLLKCLATAGAGASWKFGMFFELTSWVEGCPLGRHQVQWEASGDGSISMQRGMWQLGFEELLLGLQAVGTVVGLLFYLVQSPKRVDFFKQVLVQVARWWEQNLLSQVLGRRPVDCRLQFGLGHDTSNMTKTDISARLARYCMDGLGWTVGKRHFSVTVDKSRVGGRGKQNGALLLPGNHCFWMVPQAPSG